MQSLPEGVWPIVLLEHVVRQYPGPPAVLALRDATMRVERGEYVAIMGASGAGKSTLVNIIGLLDRPTGGRYVFDGEDTGVMTERERAWLRAVRIGVVFQAFHLMAWRPVLENVALAGVYARVPRAQRVSAAQVALERVGLQHRIDAMPANLSGGESQRVAFARAMVTSPSILLCDEPTGNLDSAATADVLELLDEFHAAGTTILIITHDQQVAARAGRTLTIADGRVV